MADLSPAAQTVAWAYDNTLEKETSNHRYHWLAAALRAAADAYREENNGEGMPSFVEGIADELETQ